MPQNLRLFVLSTLCLGGALLSGCERNKPAAAAEKPAATPAVQARYECPMGCAGSQSTKPGKCPVCAMELEKKS